MRLDPTWIDIALRIVLVTLACGALGFDRGEHGRPAGVRTTVLVGLAAAFAMIAANLLLSTSGKTEASFATADVMRLPLGILTGMGFIGAGAILRRGTAVEGLTTASTLWLATVLGIVFGAGLHLLGVAASAAGLLVVVGLGWVKKRLPRHERGELTVVSSDDIYEAALNAVRGVTTDVRVSECTTRQDDNDLHQTLRLRVTWRTPGSGSDAPPFALAVSRLKGVKTVAWRS